MNDQPFVTLAAGGMRPESSPSPLSPSLSDSSSQQESSPTSSVSITTHDISREKYHINKLGTFAARLEKAAESIFPNKGRSRYRDVQVLLLRWEEDPMGVQCEVDDLAEIFESTYGFETDTWLIPTVKSHSALTRKALHFTEEFGNADNLLIVYYAGHGLMNSSRQALWTCKSDIKSVSLEWYAIKPLFERAESDVLLILDCCAAASGAPTEGDKTSVTETIAACGFETWTPRPGRHSFTNTLIAVLDDWQKRPAFTAAMLHCEVLNRLRHEKPEKCGNTMKFEFRKSPIHIVSTSDPKARSVELCPRRSLGATSHELSTKLEAIRGRGAVLSTMELSVDEARADPSPVSSVPTAVTLDEGNDSYSMSSLTKVLDNGNTLLPQVLVSVALEEEQELDLEQFRRWLQNFPALAMYAKVQGMYKSNSTLLILSVPVVVWDWIPDDSACAFIGFVFSQDLLEWNTNKKGQLSNVPPRSATSSTATDNPSPPKLTSPHSNIANEKLVQQKLFHPDIKGELSLKMPANPLQGVEALDALQKQLNQTTALLGAEKDKVTAVTECITMLHQRRKDQDLEFDNLRSHLINIETQNFEANGIIRGLRDQIAFLKGDLLSSTTKLDDIESFTTKLQEEDVAVWTKRLNEVWEAACSVVASLFEEDLAEERLRNKSAWKDLKESRYLQHEIPLLRSNSPVAKQMRIAVLLAILARFITQHVFQPTYLLENKDERDERDEIRELLVREVPMWVRNLVSDAHYESFRLGVEDIVQKAREVWRLVQGTEEKFEVYFELNNYVDLKWQPLNFDNGRVTVGDESTVKAEDDEALLIVFPRIYIIADSEPDPVTRGVVLMKSQSTPAVEEMERENPSSPTTTRAGLRSKLSLPRRMSTSVNETNGFLS